MEEYKQGDFIKFDYQNIKGKGIVCGVSTNALPILGTGYIIELLSEIPGHEYTHIVVYDCYMKPALDLKRESKIVEILG